MNVKFSINTITGTPFVKCGDVWLASSMEEIILQAASRPKRYPHLPPQHDGKPKIAGLLPAPKEDHDHDVRPH
jgi:hypothetical protein